MSRRNLPQRVPQAEAREAVREAWARFHRAATRGDVKLREARVLSALTERTLGWNRVEDRFTHDVLADLSDQSTRTVSRALKALGGAGVFGYTPGHGSGLSIVRLPLPVTRQHVGESGPADGSGQHVGESGSGQHVGDGGVQNPASDAPAWRHPLDSMLASETRQHVGDTNDLENDLDQRSGPSEKPSVPHWPSDPETRSLGRDESNLEELGPARLEIRRLMADMFPGSYPNPDDLDDFRDYAEEDSEGEE